MNVIIVGMMLKCLIHVNGVLDYHPGKLIESTGTTYLVDFTEDFEKNKVDTELINKALYLNHTECLIYDENL